MIKDISIIIPAYNEADFIKENIQKLDKFLKERYKSYEIIVSEDGSNDGTDKILCSISRKNIKHIHFEKRLGKGRALNNAFFSSSGKRIFIIDADFPVSLDYIQKMLAFVDKYDVVIGSRLMKKSAIKRSFVRHLFSITYNILVRMLFRTGTRDHQCGVKAFKREVLSEILPSITSTGFSWDTELIVKAKMRRYKILEIPIVWKDRKFGKSKVSIYKESLKMVKFISRLWYSILLKNEQ